jgi:bacillithiol biosynthesis deacetylase BshB1
MDNPVFPETTLDVLAIGPHRDDLELSCGGTIVRLLELGYSVGMADMTAGEMGTRGTAEEREREAVAAAAALGVNYRVNLELPDGKLRDDDQTRDRLIRVIRTTRPKLVLCPYPNDWRHPDHSLAGRVVPEAAFRSGFPKWETGQRHHRPLMTIHYMMHYEFEPSFIVDITGQWEKKMESVRCYRSQVHVAGHERPSDEEQTYISRPEFSERIEARNRYFGSKIAAKYGEPFWYPNAIRIDNPMQLVAGSIENFAQRGDKST